VSGAYVAKPAAVAASPSVPPGWDVDWPFCGVSGYDPDPFFPAPHPPGYEPDYSLAVSGTESIAYDGTASITATFRDQSTYATNEPDAIVWTATVSSSPSRSVNLRFSGDEDYASSVSSVCVFGTYWGTTPDIEFELTEEDIGGTIILTAKSTISGSFVGATLSIEVGLQIVLAAHYELVGAIGDGYYYGTNEIRIQGTSILEWYGYQGWYWPDQGGWYNQTIKTEDEIEISTDTATEAGGTVTTTVLTLRAGETYEARAHINYTDCSAKVTLTITIGENEYVFVDDESGWVSGPIVEIDADTLEVTQTNP
jgi:hypothetical protein